MWNRILIGLGILLCAVLAVGLFRLFNDVSEDQSNILIESSTDTSETRTSAVLPPQLKKGTLSETEDPNEKDTPVTKSRAYYITDEDCDNRCENFEKNTESGRYCENVCGIITIDKPLTGCDAKTELSRDYCLRDEAVTAHDLNACKKISDRGVEKQCTNRITENIIDGF